MISLNTHTSNSSHFTQYVLTSAVPSGIWCVFDAHTNVVCGHTSLHMLFFLGLVVYRDCMGDFSTTCIPCSHGRFMDKPNGLYNCYICKHCSESKFLFLQGSLRIFNFTLVLTPKFAFFRCRPLRPESVYYNKRHRLWCAWWISLYWFHWFTVPTCSEAQCL